MKKILKYLRHSFSANKRTGFIQIWYGTNEWRGDNNIKISDDFEVQIEGTNIWIDSIGISIPSGKSFIWREKNN